MSQNNKERVSVFIDGFNLYHALKDMRQNHYKWLDIITLMRNYIHPPTQQLETVYYFSAHATWRVNSYNRQKAYIKALANSSVVTILGQFKEKDRSCRSCQATWKGHEEKETDVNIALCLLNEAYKNTYDVAYVVSRDSDLAPPIRMVLKEFPNKRVRVFAPPNYHHSKELAQAVQKPKRDLQSIKPIHIERSLFPQRVLDAGGNLVVTRPTEYDPPP